MAVAVFSHPSSLLHDPGPGHPESSQRLIAILDEFQNLSRAGTVEFVEAEPVEREILERVHHPEHINNLETLAQKGGAMIDGDTFLSRETFTAAVYAAGQSLAAAKCALDGKPAFAAVRPPGHHATADRAMGFCFINNVVVAAVGVLDRADVSRVLIVDWDVHHGNGTQSLVERDERIRYVSLHQWPLYPGTGRETETGVGNIFNIPRPPGLDPSEYVDALAVGVERATKNWQPDLLLISAGFDAMAGDPLAGFTLEPEHYAQWVTMWKQTGVSIAAVLEGGYDPERIRHAAAATVRAMA